MKNKVCNKLATILAFTRHNDAGVPTELQFKNFAESGRVNRSLPVTGTALKTWYDAMTM